MDQSMELTYASMDPPTVRDEAGIYGVTITMHIRATNATEAFVAAVDVIGEALERHG